MAGRGVRDAPRPSPEEVSSCRSGPGGTVRGWPWIPAGCPGGGPHAGERVGGPSQGVVGITARDGAVAGDAVPGPEPGLRGVPWHPAPGVRPSRSRACFPASPRPAQGRGVPSARGRHLGHAEPQGLLGLGPRGPRSSGLAALIGPGKRALAVLLLVVLPGRVAVRVLHAPAAAAAAGPALAEAKVKEGGSAGAGRGRAGGGLAAEGPRLQEAARRPRVRLLYRRTMDSRLEDYELNGDLRPVSPSSPDASVSTPHPAPLRDLGPRPPTLGPAPGIPGT